MNTPLARIPCTIVTGFLGAGKTTLIRHVIANANGRRLAVIVNEFGDVGIDGEILKGCGNAACPEENIVELANGCLCCTVADEFVPALDAILARDGIGTLLAAAALLQENGIGVAYIALRQPSLDEAFLALTAGAPQ